MSLTGLGGGKLLSTKPRFHLQKPEAAGDLGILSKTHRAHVTGSAPQAGPSPLPVGAQPGRCCGCWNPNKTDSFLRQVSPSVTHQRLKPLQAALLLCKRGLPSDLELRALSAGPSVPFWSRKAAFFPSGMVSQCFVCLFCICLFNSRVYCYP